MTPKRPEGFFAIGAGGLFKNAGKGIDQVVWLQADFRFHLYSLVDRITFVAVEPGQ